MNSVKQNIGPKGYLEGYYDNNEMKQEIHHHHYHMEAPKEPKVPQRTYNDVNYGQNTQMPATSRKPQENVFEQNYPENRHFKAFQNKAQSPPGPKLPQRPPVSTRPKNILKMVPAPDLSSTNYTNPNMPDYDYVPQSPPQPMPRYNQNILPSDNEIDIRLRNLQKIDQMGGVPVMSMDFLLRVFLKFDETLVVQGLHPLYP